MIADFADFADFVYSRSYKRFFHIRVPFTPQISPAGLDIGQSLQTLQSLHADKNGVT
jgi:hypothetical protein